MCYRDDIPTGTAALKGDYTRTGERGVAGMMRDGVSSMTRMYINVFRFAAIYP